jgi:hypothetical protein
LVVGGCKKGSDGTHVKGKVEYQKMPLPRGYVFFAHAGSGKFATMAPIVNGGYEVNGLSRGDYVVGVAVASRPEELMTVLPGPLVESIMQNIKGKQTKAEGRTPPRTPGGGRPRPGTGFGRGGRSGETRAPEKDGAGLGKKVSLPPDVAGKFKDLNSKYADPEKSGLQVSVGFVDTEYDLILK